MKLNNLLILSLSISLITMVSCTEEPSTTPISSQVGTWEGTEKTKTYRNDSLMFGGGFDRAFVMTLKEDGTGTLINGQNIPLYWIEDDDIMVIVQNFEGNGTGSSKFDIISNTESNQQWVEERISYDLFSNDSMRFVKKWDLTRTE